MRIAVPRPARHPVLIDTVAAAALLYAAPVAARRRCPSAALQTCAAVAVIQAPLHGNLLNGMTGILLPPLILGYSVGRHRRWWPGLLAVLSTAVLFGWGIWLSGHVPEPRQYGSTAQGWVTMAALVALPWLAGPALTHRGRRADAYRHLTEQLMAAKSDYERLVAHTQRLEIAQELDELLAHAVAAIALQAAGARRLAGREDAAAGLEETLTAIEQAGRAALADLRRLVTLMRTDPAEGPGDSGPGEPARALAAILAPKAGPA